MTYCISDLHGCYDEFMALLKKINFGEDDTLYVLGDAIDRGPEPIKCLQYIMSQPNIRMLIGNHELMMLDAFNSDFQKDPSFFAHWFKNGGKITLDKFLELSEEDQKKVSQYITMLDGAEKVIINDKSFVLVHAGLDTKQMEKKGAEATTANILKGQTLDQLVWIREKFIRNKALPKSITIFGHTPIQNIDHKCNGKVWRDPQHKDKIGIDGGCYYGGNLLALRLDDMAEFAVSGSKKS